MRNLDPAHGAPVVLDGLQFLYKTTNAEPATKAIAGPVKSARDVLEAADKAWKDGRMDVQVLTAQVQVLDGDIAEAFRPLTLGMDALVGGDANDPRRRILFPKTPSEALQGTVGPEQAKFVNGVLAVLNEDKQFATLKVHAKPIAEALAKHGAKVEERAKAEAQVTALRAAVVKALVAACEVHNQAEPKIKLALKTTQRRKIDAFFLKLGKAKKTPVE